jgi:hypothetical protein
VGKGAKASVLGIRAGAFFACWQKLSPGAQSGTAGAERRPSDAKYDDGYNSEPGSKTTIYEWYQSEINKWEKRLLAAGVKPEIYRTSKPKHCWVRFDANLLNGIGWEGRGVNGDYDDEADILANGTQTNFKDVCLLSYAQAHGGFNGEIKRYEDHIQKALKDQKNRDTSAILLIFTDWERDLYIKIARTLETVGVSVIETGKTDHNGYHRPYIIADASNISWFAYGL